MSSPQTALAVPERLEVRYPTETGEVKLNPGIVKKYLVHGKAESITQTELIMFMQLCRYQKLNPYLREAYLIKFSADDPASFVTSKDAFTKRAAAVPECEGWNAGIIVREIETKKILKRTGSNVLDGETLIGGWAKVFRKGWREPIEIEVSLKEYMRYSRGGEPTRSWKTMPATMIRKCALVPALREAFPDRFANQYTPEEMPVDDTELPTNAVQVSATEEAELEAIPVEATGTPSTTPETSSPAPAAKKDSNPFEAKAAEAKAKADAAEAKNKQREADGKAAVSGEKARPEDQPEIF